MFQLKTNKQTKMEIKKQTNNGKKQINKKEEFNLSL